MSCQGICSSRYFTDSITNTGGSESWNSTSAQFLPFWALQEVWIRLSKTATKLAVGACPPPPPQVPGRFETKDAGGAGLHSSLLFHLTGCDLVLIMFGGVGSLGNIYRLLLGGSGTELASMFWTFVSRLLNWKTASVKATVNHRIWTWHRFKTPRTSLWFCETKKSRTSTSTHLRGKSNSNLISFY